MNMHRLARQSTFVVTAVLGLMVRTTSAPRLVLGEEHFEFGQVPQNSRITHVFWLYSKGDDSLKIIQVIPGCSCTQAPLSKQEIAPGDSTSLEIIFDTRSYQGGVTKSPVIKSNEGQPDKNVRFHAEVVARPDSTYPIIIKPYKLDLTQVGEKVRSEITFSITNVSDSLVRPTVISSVNDLFDITLPNAIQAGQTGEAVLRLKKSAIDTSFEKCLTLQLDDEKQSRFTIPVKRTLRNASAAIPPTPTATPLSGH